MSGFSFMSSEERDSETNDSSGFDFMSRGDDDDDDDNNGDSELQVQSVAQDDVTNDDDRQSGSGFGFMGGGLTGDQEENVDEDNGSGGGFNFMNTAASSGVTSSLSQSYTMSAIQEDDTEETPEPQEIKLAATASKVARKKKRTSTVGAERNKEVEKEPDPPPPSAKQPAPVMTETVTPTPNPTAVKQIPATTVTHDHTKTATNSIQQTQVSTTTTITPTPTIPHSVVPLSSVSHTPSTVNEVPPSTKQQVEVVHLADKPSLGVSSNHSNKSIDKSDTMSEGSDDNNSTASGGAGAGVSPVTVAKKKEKRKNSFMSLFQKKKEVEEVKAVPESSQSYKPSQKVTAKLSVQQTSASPGSDSIKQNSNSNVTKTPPAEEYVYRMLTSIPSAGCRVRREPSLSSDSVGALEWNTYPNNCIPVLGPPVQSSDGSNLMWLKVSPRIYDVLRGSSSFAPHDPLSQGYVSRTSPSNGNILFEIYTSPLMQSTPAPTTLPPSTDVSTSVTEQPLKKTPSVKTIEENHSVAEKNKAPSSSSSSAVKQTEVVVEKTKTKEEQKEVVQIQVQQVQVEVAPKVPPPPKAILVSDNQLCLKIQELSLEVIAGFKSNVTDISAYQQTLIEGMNDHLQRRQTSEANVRVLLQKIEEAEIEQNRLAEAEEFEKADALSSRLEELREEYARSLEAVKESLASYEEAENSLEECRVELSNKMNETARGLANLIRQQTEELNEIVTVNLRALSIEDKRVKAEEERVSIELEHVDREKVTLDHETSVIEKAIFSQTTEVQTGKRLMHKELTEVKNEIKRLEDELELKRQEQKKLENNILVSDGKINEVRRKYDRQLQRISDRSVTIKQAHEECQTENNFIVSQRNHYNSEKKKLTDMECDVKTFIKNMEKERSIAMELKKCFDASRLASKEMKFSSKSSHSGGATNAAALRDKLTSEEMTLQKALSALELIQKSIKELNDEDQGLSEKIPQLELEKKGHASNKRFKEAANVAKDIKTMTSRKEEIALLVSENSSQVGDKESAIVEAKNAVEITQCELKAAEREVDLSKFELLLQQAKSLRIASRSLEQSQSPASASDRIILSSVALDLLSLELKTVLEEAGRIKEKHGLDVSLTPPLDDEKKSDEVDDKKQESQVTDVPETHSSKVDVQNSPDNNEENEEDKSLSEDIENTLTTNDDTGTSVDKEQEEEQGVEEEEDFDEEEMKLKAQALLSSIKDLEVKLEVAVDTEEYDDAATLSEQVDEQTEELNKMLSALGLSRQDLESN